MREQEIRVLIVEDEPLVSRMVRNLLEQIGCTVVGEARDGRQGVEMAEALRPDLILMDIEMPHMDGIEATQQIQERCPTPVVLLTAHESLDLVRRASAVGVGAYLLKPPNQRELERAIAIARARFDDMTALRHINAELQQVNSELAREITERMQAEEKLQQTLDELARSNQELEHFASIASHDLQEPLRMVGGYVQLLAQRYQGQLDANADEFIGYVLDGVSRMQALIKALLDYSRVGTRGRAFAATDCADVLDHALWNLQLQIQKSAAEVSFDSLPTVLGDELQLLQVFQNLVGNAIKFCDQATPQIHVSVEQQGDHWTFAVRDNGIGIDPQHFERLFQVFYRLHTRDEYPGTGIGLATCNKIVQRHGGRIWVESQAGEGSAFYFTLPAMIE